MITLVMQLQSRCQQCSSSPAVIQWVTSTVSLELLSDFRGHTHLAETSEEKLKRFFQIFVYDMYVLMYVLIFYFWLYRSSLQRCSVKKGVLKKFAIFPGKHLCWSAFLRELHVRRPATLLKRVPNTGVFLLILRSS